MAEVQFAWRGKGAVEFSHSSLVQLYNWVYNSVLRFLAFKMPELIGVYSLELMSAYKANMLLTAL